MVFVAVGIFLCTYTRERGKGKEEKWWKNFVHTNYRKRAKCVGQSCACSSGCDCPHARRGGGCATISVMWLGMWNVWPCHVTKWLVIVTPWLLGLYRDPRSCDSELSLRVSPASKRATNLEVTWLVAPYVMLAEVLLRRRLSWDCTLLRRHEWVGVTDKVEQPEVSKWGSMAKLHFAFKNVYRIVPPWFDEGPQQPAAKVETRETPFLFLFLPLSLRA